MGGNIWQTVTAADEADWICKYRMLPMVLLVRSFELILRVIITTAEKEMLFITAVTNAHHTKPKKC